MSQPSNQSPEEIHNAAKPGDDPGASGPETQKGGVQPSGANGDNPAPASSAAGPGKTEVRSNTPENALGHLNPSAPEDARAD
jgi:hypothetical protein